MAGKSDCLQVSDIVNGELEFRFGRIMGNLTIIQCCAEKYGDTSMQHKIREIRQAVAGLIAYAKRKHGLKVPIKKEGD